MVEPQDPNRHQQMMSRQTEAVLAIAQMNQSLPQEFEEEAKNSLDALVSFRQEIHKDLTDLQGQVNVIKEKFQDKLHQDGLKRGFLMSQITEYEKCLQFDRAGLDRLLNEDQDIWTINMKEAQQRAQLAQERIQGFLEKQQEDLLNFLKQNELTTITGRPVLRKLPLWGIQDVPENEINFEWPKKSDLDQFNIKKIPELERITFWFKDANTVCMRGVQFDHVDSNFKSPVFETGDVMACSIKVGKEVIQKTTQVVACCRETQRDSIKSIAFSNNGGQLADVDHYQREVGYTLQYHSLEPDEEIIGGYGVSNRQRFITSFGFIAVKRNT